MQTTFKFKLCPNVATFNQMIEWQRHVSYVKNRMIGDREFTYHSHQIMGDYCSLFNKQTYTVSALRSDLYTRIVSSGLFCSVNRNATLGFPWKTGDEKRARSRRNGLSDVPKKASLKRTAYEMQASSLLKLKSEKPELKSVNAFVLQKAVAQVDVAFQKFFNKKSGYPSYTKPSKVGFEFDPGAVKIDLVKSILYLTGLGWIKFHNSRQWWDNIKTGKISITRESSGFYVSILIKDDSIPAIPHSSLDECQTIQGCDVGIKKLASLSDGTFIQNPQFLKRSERRLTIRQRRVSRKQKNSNKRKKAVDQLSKTHELVRRQREDYQWKVGKQIASKADITVFEDLNIKGMKSRCKPKKDEITGKYIKNGQAAKSALNKAISDASWYSLRKKTEHQASKLGNIVIGVNPKYTSQECPECHHISPGNREKEKFICEECGYADDADTNGAVNICNRGKTILGRDTLLVVSQKVTPVKSPREKASSVSRDESGNPAKSNVKQLRLITVKSVSVEKKPSSRARSKQKTPEVGIQLNLFDYFDGDAKESQTKAL